jgi:hypothetical protein
MNNDQTKSGGHSQKEYQRKYHRKRKDGHISTRDASVLNLPPLQVLCKAKKKANRIACHCSELTRNSENQQLLRQHYTAVVRKSTSRGAGNELLVSYIKPPLKSDEGKYDKLLRDGKGTNIVNYSYRLPLYDEKENRLKGDIILCSPVFKKLFNLGKPRLKKLQELSTLKNGSCGPRILKGMRKNDTSKEPLPITMTMTEQSNPSDIPRTGQEEVIHVRTIQMKSEKMLHNKDYMDNRDDVERAESWKENKKRERGGKDAKKSVGGMEVEEVVHLKTIQLLDDDLVPHAQIMGEFGRTVDVPANGNCGFAVLIWGLHYELKLEPKWTVGKFRECIRVHAVEKEQRVFGMSFYRYSKNRRNNEQHLRFEKKMWTKTLDMLYREERNYQGGARVEEWLDGAKHFPIIADRFKVNIVIYVLDPISPYTDVYKVISGGTVEKQTLYANLRPPRGDGLDKSRTVYMFLADAHYQGLSVVSNYM